LNNRFNAMLRKPNLRQRRNDSSCHNAVYFSRSFTPLGVVVESRIMYGTPHKPIQLIASLHLNRSYQGSIFLYMRASFSKYCTMLGSMSRSKARSELASLNGPSHLRQIWLSQWTETTTLGSWYWLKTHTLTSNSALDLAVW